MSPLVKTYLNKFHASLKALPEEEQQDAIREIESHIMHGLRDGQSDKQILAKLGDPKKLAKAYSSEYISQANPRSFKEVMTMIGFYCTAGLLSIAVVPILGVIAYGFGFCAVIIVIAGIIRSFGVTWIDMTIAPGYEVPIVWSFPFALVIASIIGAIAFISWKNLKSYLAALSSRYHSMLETTIRG
ncbi:DUF1700 domain-containing protein [Paenibacillus herberti]|uniref:DUF1700 domain-containing protein n=1 Tax=Paenibacillus herberti TaxID=1619309 RepID=A0A229NXR1_9BACL|nr:DUF1700 domain-containing protein [Paenibacillus herberti]OXM14648.1 hypothetical protein CGZ75_17190 [Paenibacillus herberti]